MATKFKFPPRGTSRSNEVHLTGTFTIGGAGALSASSSECSTVAKTGGKTGRYTLTFDRKYKNVRVTSMPGLIGPADAAIGNASGNDTFWRNVSGTGADIQLYLSSSGADTEATSGTVIHWEAWAQE